MQTFDGVTYDFAPGTMLDTLALIAISYLVVDFAWIAMTWSSSSIGTPTQPMRRDQYVRNLMIFKILSSILFPLSILGFGLYSVYYVRTVCEDYPYQAQDEGPLFTLICVLLFTYSLELLV